jgi:hypothetical protein
MAKKSLWKKVQRDKKWLVEHDHSQDYVSSTQNGDAEYNLIMIDNPVRRVDCQEATTKQWDTIIREAKEANKVSAAAKLAVFYWLGFTIGSPFLKIGTNGRSRMKKKFKIELDENELAEKLKGLPVPLEDFRRTKSTKKTLIKSGEMPPVEEPSKGSDETNKPISTSDEVEEPQVSSNIYILQILKLKMKQRQNLEKTVPNPGVQQARHARHAHTFIGPWSAEEHLNDSEWVRGEGIVPINRNYGQANDGPNSVEDKPLELSPDNYACQDHSLPLVQFLTVEKIINLQEIQSQLLSSMDCFLKILCTN